MSVCKTFALTILCSIIAAVKLSRERWICSSEAYKKFLPIRTPIVQLVQALEVAEFRRRRRGEDIKKKYFN